MLRFDVERHSATRNTLTTGILIDSTPYAVGNGPSGSALTADGARVGDGDGAMPAADREGSSP